METKDIGDCKLVTSIYSDVASPAMKQIGQSAEGLLKFVALPFRFLGLTAEQLEKKYTKFIEEAVNRVPPQKLTAPQSSVAAPLLDYVKFCFVDEPGNDLLQEMFSKLLSSAINQDNVSYLNKSFVETMKFLSCNEAKLLQWCSDAIITRRAYDNLEPPIHFMRNFAVLSVFKLHDYDIKGYVKIRPQIMEISVGQPCSFVHFDFPIESLDILTFLGLIEPKNESYIGRDLFEDLIRLKHQGLVEFEIPPLFASAMSYVEDGKASDIMLPPTKSRYPDLLLSLLLETEIHELHNALSQNQNISMEQLMRMECFRSEIHITQYGHRFLDCCIQ